MRLLLAASLIVPSLVLAEDDAAFFRDKVSPILAGNCFKCHSHEAHKSKGGLVVDSRASLLAGGDSGAAIVPGKPEQSLLIKAVRYDDADLQMPPPKGDSKKLTDAQISTLTEWVKRGAPWPDDGKKLVARAKGGITDEERKWWAFQPMGKPEVPKSGATNPIDAFLYGPGKLPGAAKAEQVVRRLYFDLTGLPPTPEEVTKFVVSCGSNPAAMDGQVAALADSLLASPRYGERWARQWLDLARFAESDGYKIDEFRPTSWRYRDYVVRSLNSDKPYDRFVQEQLAGDELWPGDVDAQTATGFLRAGIYEYNNRDVIGQWTTILNEVTDVTADVFLGLGVQCARCHDHKFDPILQKDYFRLQAFFAPMRWVDDAVAATPAERAAYGEKLAAWAAKTADVRTQIAVFEDAARSKAKNSAIEKFPEDVQAIMLKNSRTPGEQQIHELAFRQVQYEWDHLLNHVKGADKDPLIKLQKQLSTFDAEKPAPLPTVLAIADIGAMAPPTRIPKKEGDIEPGFPTILDAAPAKITPYANSTGRRTALAKWLTNPENPLTARVIVNRIWQHHFGQGLVANASDLGKLGGQPSNPELLDWLARRFVADGWSLKKLHRLIVTSAAYRGGRGEQWMVNSGQPPAAQPSAMPLSQASPRRLDAEQVRDAILAVTGELELKDGGPSAAWDKPRRTIYTKILRNTRDALLDVFDLPEGFQSTAQRNTTTTSTQALTMFNGPWMLARARALAERVTRESSADDGERANAAMRLAWQREPTAAEVKGAREFIDAQAAAIEARPPEMKPITLTTEKMPFREGRGVVLTPSGLDRLFMRAGTDFPDGDFTIEAFIVLNSLYTDGQVRTIASHWTGAKEKPGWTFGVTGKQSRYKPQALVLMLNGEGSPQKEAEPVFAGLHLEIGKPYFVAASIRLAEKENGITFYAKDLSNDDLPLQIATVAHTTTAGIRGDTDFVVGARGTTAKTNVWDGIIDDVRLTRAALPAESLLLNSGQAIGEHTVGYWRFETGSGLYKDSSPRGHDIVAKIAQSKPTDARKAALVDFCHVLLNSNEFLYVD